MQVFEFDSVDSTNETAKRLVRERRLTEFGYVVARQQTAGKGQRGRVWVSPRDAGLYLSVVDPLPTVPIDPKPYTLAAGVACAEALESTTGIAVRLKPVNDLYVEDRKLGGILCEIILEPGSHAAADDRSESRRDTVQVLITGIGINVRVHPRELPAGGAEPVSLQELMAAHQFAHFELPRLRDAVIERVRTWNAVAHAGDSESIQRGWSARSLEGKPETLRVEHGPSRGQRP